MNINDFPLFEGKKPSAKPEPEYAKSDALQKRANEMGRKERRRLTMKELLLKIKLMGTGEKEKKVNEDKDGDQDTAHTAERKRGQVKRRKRIKEEEKARISNIENAKRRKDSRKRQEDVEITSRQRREKAKYQASKRKAISAQRSKAARHKSDVSSEMDRRKQLAKRDIQAFEEGSTGEYQGQMDDSKPRRGGTEEERKERAGIGTGLHSHIPKKKGKKGKLKELKERIKEGKTTGEDPYSTGLRVGKSSTPKKTNKQRFMQINRIRLGVKEKAKKKGGQSHGHEAQKQFNMGKGTGEIFGEES